MNRIIFLLFFLSIQCSLFSQYTVSGTVTNSGGEPIDFTSVFLKDSEYATSTIQDGTFRLLNVKPGKYIIKASFIGYESIEKQIVVEDSMTVDLAFIGTIFQLDEIEINSNQANVETPVSYTTMSKEEIEDANIAQDLPYMLRWMPSVTVTSDAGAGIGYTGIKVRGSDASRTNVTINGVPLNDSESQSVFWVDLPDFMSNVTDVQLQRGVGVSTNGTSAFGANLHLNTQNIRQNSFAVLSGALGSYNTSKFSAFLGTGLLNNKFSLEGRMSWINSDGYVDRASSDLSSYYLSASRVSESSSLRLNVFSGAEVTYQSWNGLPYQYLESDRTYNSAGTEKSIDDPYDNEVDNYRQTHIQLIYNRAVGEKANFNATGYVTSGRGYFENYKAQKLNSDFNLTPDTLFQDIVIQRWLDNVLTGAILTYEYSTKRMNIVVGGHVNQYLSSHFGDVTWRENGGKPEEQKAINYYANRASKQSGNINIRANYTIAKKFVPFIDLQYRVLKYTYEGPDDTGEILDITDQLGFFNPKVGLSFLPSKKHKFFAFYGVANREPGRQEYVGSTPQSRPTFETLYDTEIGYSGSTKYLKFDVTVYNMNYNNQLVPTGKLSDVGAAILTNVEQSYRRGVEFGLLAKATGRINIGYYTTLSANKIIGYDEYIDVWETEEQIVIEHEISDIAYSPSQLHTITSRFDLLPERRKDELSLQANWKMVGAQYLDNSSNPLSKLESFSYLDAMFHYKTKFWKVKKMTVSLQVNNVLNNKYVSNGWIYRHIPGSYLDESDPYQREESDGYYSQVGYFPQATTNFLLGVKFEF